MGGFVLVQHLTPGQMASPGYSSTGENCHSGPYNSSQHMFSLTKKLKFFGPGNCNSDLGQPPGERKHCGPFFYGIVHLLPIVDRPRVHQMCPTVAKGGLNASNGESNKVAKGPCPFFPQCITHHYGPSARESSALSNPLHPSLSCSRGRCMLCAAAAGGGCDAGRWGGGRLSAYPKQ